MPLSAIETDSVLGVGTRRALGFPLSGQRGTGNDDPEGSWQGQKKEELQAKENTAKPNPKRKPGGQMVLR